MVQLTLKKINQIYSRKDIYEELRGIVDITEREISYWMDLEIVVPDIANPKGQGKTRYHSIYNLIDFAVAKKLSLAGMSLKTIKGVMQYLRNRKREKSYLAEEDKRLIIINPNTDNLRVYFEGADAFSPSNTEALLNRIAENIAFKKMSQERSREIILVGEKFETLFVLNITPLVKKILGVTE